MTLRRSENTWVRVTMPRTRLTATDIAAALMGVVAALGVLASMGAVLGSGFAGVVILEASNLEWLAASTVAAAIVLVFAAFFCGGWTYGALRGRAKRGRLGDVHYGEPHVQGPARWAGTATRRSTHMHSISMKWDGRRDEVVGRIR